MKKSIVALFACLSLATGAYAQEAAETTQPEQQKPAQPQRVESRTIETVPFAFGGEETIDIVGLRLSAWGKCNDITGLDLAIGGEAANAHGLQPAPGRNKGIGRAGVLQPALGWDEAGEPPRKCGVRRSNHADIAKGLQVGLLLNSADDMRGVQIGLVNTANTIYGYQIGLINVIKSSPVTFLPIINFMLGY